MDTSWRGCRVRQAGAGWVQCHPNAWPAGPARCRRGAASPVWKTSDFVVVSSAQQQVPVCRTVPATAAGEGRGPARPLRLSFPYVLPAPSLSPSKPLRNYPEHPPGRHASSSLFQKQELTILWGEGWPGSPSSTRGHVLMTSVPAMLLRWRSPEDTPGPGPPAPRLACRGGESGLVWTDLLLDLGICLCAAESRRITRGKLR